MSPGGRNWFGTRSLFVRKCYLPYGMWTCADGREVLFNRFYEPIWQRYKGAPAERADPTEWVKFIKQSFFYNDGLSRRRAAA